VFLQNACVRVLALVVLKSHIAIFSATNNKIEQHWWSYC